MSEETEVNVLEKAMENLKVVLEETKLQNEELEDELQISEDARLRLEVNLMAAKKNHERELRHKDQQHEEEKQRLVRQLCEVKAELETVKELASTTTDTKKVESELKDLESQIEAAGGGIRTDAIPQLYELQDQMKDLNKRLDEAHSSRTKTAADAKEMEVKFTTLEDLHKKLIKELQDTKNELRLQKEINENTGQQLEERETEIQKLQNQLKHYQKDQSSS